MAGNTYLSTLMVALALIAMPIDGARIARDKSASRKLGVQETNGKDKTENEIQQEEDSWSTIATKTVSQCTIEGPPGSGFSYRFEVRGGRCRTKCLGAKMTLHEKLMPTFMRADPGDTGKTCTCFSKWNDKKFLSFPTHGKSQCTAESCWEEYLRLGNAGKAKQYRMSASDASTMQQSCQVCVEGKCAEPSGLSFDGLNFDETQIALLKAGAEKGDSSAQEQLEILNNVEIGDAINQPVNVVLDEQDDESTIVTIDNEEPETDNDSIAWDDDSNNLASSGGDEKVQIAPNRIVLERDGFCVPASRSGLVGKGMKSPTNKDCTQFKLIANGAATGTFQDLDSGLCLGYLAKDNSDHSMGEGLNGLVMSLCGINIELKGSSILQMWWSNEDQYCVGQDVCLSRRL